MAISLSSLRRVGATDPARILLYGVPKIGKSTLASEFPNPVFIQAEDGTPGGVEIMTFGTITRLDDVYDAFTALDSEDHDFQTLVIDSLSALEQFIWADVCERNRWQSIESPGYGKGYIECDLAWLKIMQAVNYLRSSRQMMIVLIAHSEIKHVEDPLIGPFDRFSVQLHKRAVEIVNKEVDVIAFLNYRNSISETSGPGGKKIRKAVGAGDRILHFADRPGFVAGDRYSLPDDLPYIRGHGFEAIAPFLPNGASAVVDDQKEAA
jgi:hypothetical protein